MSTEGYLSVAEVAEGWGVTPRRVRDFCQSGRIAGAKFGERGWMIPADAQKPADGRTLAVRGTSSGISNDNGDPVNKPIISKEAKTMSKNRNLMNYCPEIKVLDCTLRDGGLVNNFGFTDEFVQNLYQMNLAAGVDCMEFGYKASKNMFKVSDFGKWKFCDEESIRAIVGENNTPLQISVMADAGRCDYKTDILPKKDSVVDIIRVACYIHQVPLAIDMIEDAKAKGYKVTCNLMAVSKVSGEDLDKGIKMIASSPVDVLYLVDSFGNFCPEQIAGLAQKYVDAMQGKQAGFHGHNNQMLAFANTIEACRQGVNYLDATVSGLGRGAGNCYLEQLLSFLKNPKYRIEPVLMFIEKQIPALRASGAVWGYDTPYLLTGVMNSHPSSAIKFIKERRGDYANFWQELMENE